MIVLGIDQAATSGWCIARRVMRGDRACEPEIIAHGTCREAIERRDIVRRAIDEAGMTRIVAVYEQHTVGGGGRWNPETMIGMGDARGRWLEQLELADVARRRCVGVTPHEWRRAMIGGGRRSREEWKAAAVASARARGIVVGSDDEAEAVLIAMWGARWSDAVAGLFRVTLRAR